MKKLLTFALTGALLTGCLYDYNSNKPLTGQFKQTVNGTDSEYRQDEIRGYKALFPKNGTGS